ncbi:restriction endonuclease subunit S [Mycoplasma capricolum]|uniref:restriction endonuclease subunit S n=1 Tax=Mycoplasma capricolum TaxID=2095 RepID=UPI003DA4D301
MKLWEVVYFDKKFKGVEKNKQKSILKYQHISSEELKSIKKDDEGNVRLLSTGKLDGYCSIESTNIWVNFGEVITIPTGGSAILKYHNGYFIDSLNILLSSQNTNLYDLKYIYYCLLDQIDYIQQCFKGSSIQHPEMKKIIEISLLIPDIKTQKFIVKIIELLEPLISVYSKLSDELKLLNEEFPKKLQKSIINYAMTGKLIPINSNDDLLINQLLDNINNEKLKLFKQGKASLDKSIIYKNASDNSYYEKFENGEIKKIEIPFEIPDNWIWTRLGSIANIVAGGTPSRNISHYWNGHIPWLKIADISSSKKIVMKSSEFITDKAIQNSSAKIFKKGTIVYSIFGSIGKVAFLGIDSAFNQAIVAIDTYDKNIDEYLYLSLLNLDKQISKTRRGSSQFNINQTILKNFLIPLPPLEEQKRIATKIKIINNLIQSLKYFFI